MSTDIENLFKDKVLGHPAGLFVLFFTEMWERFSFYGMRVLLFNFLTMAAIGYNPGWEWTVENAGALFGTYAMLLYITPILGGWIADKYTGYRWAVIIGAFIMTLGHVSMAFETEMSLYLGLVLLVVGTGFFKPTMTSIISEMYKDNPEKKDGAYTIYYMGVNAGAFFGMMLCGYLAEKVGWAYGFGLAGVFMLLGTLQFWLSGRLFGQIGAKPSVLSTTNVNLDKNDFAVKNDKEEEPLNPYTLVDKVLIIIASVLGLGYAINDPVSKIGGVDVFSVLQIGDFKGQYVAALVALVLFSFLVVSRILRYTKIVRDRMLAFIIFAFFTVFFWLSFEQGASSLVIFARDNVNRLLSGSMAILFNIINTLLTVVPLIIISYVLYILWKKTFNKIPGSNIVLVVCFVLMWGIVVWMLNRDYNTTAYDITYSSIQQPVLNASGVQKKDKSGALQYHYIPVTQNTVVSNQDKIVSKTTTVSAPFVNYKVGDRALIINKDKDLTAFSLITQDYKKQELLAHAKTKGRDSGIIKAKIAKVRANEVEITVSWFSVLNSFFIIVFASLFSKWWESKYNPSAATKYALGLITMALGFGLLAFGSMGVVDGVKVSMVWLILAYLFHTIGELCLSPVGLSYVSKLVPARMIALMFGMWYLAIAIGNKLAALLGGEIENITKAYSLSTFFLIFTIVPFAAGILVYLLNPVLKKLMHGVK